MTALVLEWQCVDAVRVGWVPQPAGPAIPAAIVGPPGAAGTGGGSGEPAIATGTTVQYWRGDKSWQTLDKAAVGLGNVDNTGDASKPVSTAQAAAIAGKQPLATVLTNTTASFTIAQETKLSGVAAGATANDTDANLKARANHTGTQAVGTISGNWPVAQLNGGTGASSTTFWRGDGTWATPAGGSTTQDIFVNFKESNTRQLTKMIGNVVSGIGGGRILFLGDSYPAGYGSDGSSSHANAQVNSMTARFAAILAARGLKAQEKSFFFDRGIGVIADMASCDPRLSFGGSPVALGDSTYMTLAGGGVFFGSTADKLTFTPAGSFNKVEIYFFKNTSGYGSFRVSFDGGTTTAQTVTDNDAIGVASVTVTAPAPATAVTLLGNNNYSVMIGLICRNTNSDEIYVINAGRTSRTLQTMAAAPGSTTTTGAHNVRACLPVVLPTSSPNLTIINGWYNDWAAGRTSAQAAADLTTLITAAKAQGDVMYLTYGNIGTGTCSQAIQDEYTAACIAVAIAADIPVLNVRAKLPSYAIGQPMGYYTDPIHYREIGHAAFGYMIAGALNELRTG